MKIASSNICRMRIAAAATLALQSQAAHADENGVSLWPANSEAGRSAGVPGWSLGTMAYHITWQLPAVRRHTNLDRSGASRQRQSQCQVRDLGRATPVGMLSLNAASGVPTVGSA